MTRNALFKRVAGASILAAFLALAVASVASAEPDERAKRDRRAGFDLLRASSTWTAQTNKVQCGLDNQGNVCTDVFGSPTGGGGFWPTGSPNQYIFNSGLQIAGVVAQDAGFAWAGDTVGAFFFDARGTQPQGQQVTLIYSSVNPDDIASWPNGAVVRDADLYNPALLGRDAISQEDTWVRYWDGPSLLSGRSHPMGILVEQRGLAWNFPSGNEDIIYFIYTFTNISASDASAYAALDPAIQSEIAAIGADWVSQTEDRTGIDIPAGGYTIDSLFAAFAMDPDVGTNARVNASTAILPFQMGVAYKTDFSEPTWLFPSDIHGPPFGPFPGFIGVKYLKSPEDVGLTLFSNTTNSARFPDPVGVSQLWRYLSGRITAAEGDPDCDINPPIQRRLCSLVQSPDDTRFYQASGPLSLSAGQSATIVVAYIHAAPVASVVQPFVGGTLAPGIPPSGTQIAVDPSLLREIELGSGWLGQNDADGDGVIRQDEVVTLDRSLLQKSLVAQNLFDGQFLLPFAPESPDFFLVAGDNQVTIVWQQSVTETIGDPYFAIASDPTSALNDVNYRFNDVEGYRIYRGRSRAQLELLAQFDYSGTTFVDFTGQWAYDGKCAPELGILDDCPSFPNEIDLVGDVSQVPPGGRAELAGGDLQEFTDFPIGDGDATNSPPLDDLNPTVVPGSVTITVGASVATDNGAGGFTGDVSAGSIDYLTGAISITWVRVIPDTEGITVDYKFTPPLGSGGVLITNSVNPLEDGGFPELANTGVPFAFVDQAVVNSTTYFYAVTAFDFNSVKSGPASLESPLAAQSVTPRTPAPNQVLATFTSFLSGDDGVRLDPNASLPLIDSDDGTFSGPFPPTNAYTTGFAPVIQRLLPAFSLAATIDSVVVYASSNSAGGTQENPSPECPEIPFTNGRGASPFGACWAVHLTIDLDGQTTQTVFRGYNPWWGAFGEPPQYGLESVRKGVPLDAASLQQFGIPTTGFSSNAAVDVQVQEAINNSAAQGPQSRRFGNWHGGSRWFDGDSEAGDRETVADPTRFIRVGSLSAVDTVWKPVSHTPPDAGQAAPSNTLSFEKQCFNRALAYLGRAADVRFTWGGGTFSEVRDVTHHVNVPFDTEVGTTWGFLTTDANGNGFLDWQDFNYIDGALQMVRNVDGGNCDAVGGGRFDPGFAFTPVPLVNTPTIVPTSTDGLTFAGIAGMVQTGTGFGLFVNGERFIFETATLPGDGTVWTLRSYSGTVPITGDPNAADPTGYSYVVSSTGRSIGLRPLLIPGLTFNFTSAQATTTVALTDSLLDQVHTVPDPYYVTSGLELTPGQKIIRFVNLPPQAIIRIYSLSGVLVDVVEHQDVSLGGEATWSVRNRNNQFVASGVYFYHVETPSGLEKIGRFTVVNASGLAIGQGNQ
jgi:hypothetical protein